MNIALATNGTTLDSIVCTEFAHADFLLIVNVDTMDVTAIAHQRESTSDQKMAERILETQCEAVITGIIRTEAFNILANNHVTRFLGSGLTAGSALQAMEARALDLVRNPDGVEGCQTEHAHSDPHSLHDLRSCSDHVH